MNRSVLQAKDTSQVAGYDVRKHPTFRLTCVENRRFVASLPPLDLPDGEWYRLE